MNIIHKADAAFSLVEVTIALGVAAFCLVAIFGLLPIGLNSKQTSTEQTAAANIATSILADLRAVPMGSNTPSPRFTFIIPSAGSASTSLSTIYLRQDGNPSTGKSVGDAPVAAESRYRATVIFTPPDLNQKMATVVRILITWPAMADSDPASWPAKFSGSYEILTALDRN